MTFKATNQVTADSYANIKRQAVETKAYMTAQATAMQAATTPATTPLSVLQHLQKAIALFDGWTSTPGIAAYAQQQENDPAYDVAAEYTAMRSAMVNTLNQLVSTFPASGGFMAYQTLNLDGTIAVRTFTAAQLSQAVTLCNNVAATIS